MHNKKRVCVIWNLCNLFFVVLCEQSTFLRLVMQLGSTVQNKEDF
jgi:hypothetical protein